MFHIVANFRHCRNDYSRKMPNALIIQEKSSTFAARNYTYLLFIKMKKKKTIFQWMLLVVLCCSLSTSFTACSDDDVLPFFAF